MTGKKLGKIYGLHLARCKSLTEQDKSQFFSLKMAVVLVIQINFDKAKNLLSQDTFLSTGYGLHIY